jgi:acyl-CoA thioesterase I
MLRRLAARWPRLRPLLPAALFAAGWPACATGEGPLVVFLGDSLTSGWRLPETEAYPALVGRALAARGRPVRVVNAGRSGDTAAQGLARLPGVLALRPDVVVVAFGANDGLGASPLDETEAALRRIVLDARAAGARVLLVGVRLGTGELAPRVGAGRGDAARAERLFGIQAGLAAAHRVPFVPDLLAGVTGEEDLLFPDRLHPSAAGQQRLAENVRPQIELLLAEVEAGRR